MPMKNVSEAMGLRNALLANLERALTCSTTVSYTHLIEKAYKKSDVYLEVLSYLLILIAVGI